MKRVGHLMEQITTVDNLLAAFHKARKCKDDRSYVVAYRENLFENILALRESLLRGTTPIGQYNYFTIYDPKKRQICAAAFQERIVHHAIINICHAYFDKNLIYDTYASRLGKGVYAAIDRAREAMRCYAYVGKLDVRKFFDSVPHEGLKARLAHLYKDPQLLKLFGKIIDSYRSQWSKENPDGVVRGIPIGNLTSQYFANFYLSFLDHYAKEQLRVPVYIRYMDDILVFGRDKAEVQAYVRAMDAFLTAQLGLVFKPVVLNRTTLGVSFLGYALYPHKILLNRRSKLRFKRKLKIYTQKYENGVWNDTDYMLHITPLLAFAQKAYTKKFRRSLNSA